MEMGSPKPVFTKDPFVVMVKPMGSACNLRCSYCYYLDAGTRTGKPHQTRMTDEMLEEFIRGYIKASPGPNVSFVWHGGEPTLAGLPFFEKAVALQKKYLPEGFSCWNNLQTNGILLDEEWCRFLAENHFDVGLSIDGASWIHDRFRKDINGNGTYDRTVEAAKRLKAAGIRPDLLCTVTRASSEEPLAVYRALRGLDTGWIQFIPIVCRDEQGNVTPDSVTPEGYGRFLSVIFDEWLQNDLGKLDVQLFAEMATVYAGRPASLCYMAPRCGRVLIVEHDGSVYSCDHFVDGDHRIGNIAETSLGALVDSPLQKKFGGSKEEKLTAKCKRCPWLFLCRGGCLKDRFAVTEDGEEGLYYLCKGMEAFFAHTEKPVKTVMEMVKKGKSPSEISSFFRMEAKKRWEGVGRNDPCPCGSGKKAKNCCWDFRP